jgi:hypothetical protein
LLFNGYRWEVRDIAICSWLLQAAGRPLVDMLSSANNRARALAAAALADVSAGDPEARTWVCRVRGIPMHH